MMWIYSISILMRYRYDVASSRQEKYPKRVKSRRILGTFLHVTYYPMVCFALEERRARPVPVSGSRMSLFRGGVAGLPNEASDFPLRADHYDAYVPSTRRRCPSDSDSDG